MGNADDLPSLEPLLTFAQLNHRVEVESAQIPNSFADLLRRIQTQISPAIPAKDRRVVAAVCRAWRPTFLETSSCWEAVTQGRNSQLLFIQTCLGTVSF